VRPGAIVASRSGADGAETVSELNERVANLPHLLVSEHAEDGTDPK
jgi:hypothetical protein